MGDDTPDPNPIDPARTREATRPRLEAEFSVADMNTVVTVDVEAGEDAEVVLVRDGDEVVRQGAAGRYALVWFPADRDR